MRSQYPWDLARLSIEASLRTPLRRVRSLLTLVRSPPDVILLDLSLPDMHGLEVARLVRRNEKTSRIPILAMSGSGSPMDKKKCLEMGCNDFIHKPFSGSSLLVRLSALIP